MQNWKVVTKTDQNASLQKITAITNKFASNIHKYRIFMI